MCAVSQSGGVSDTANGSTTGPRGRIDTMFEASGLAAGAQVVVRMGFPAPSTFRRRWVATAKFHASGAPSFLPMQAARPSSGVHGSPIFAFARARAYMPASVCVIMRGPYLPVGAGVFCFSTQARNAASLIKIRFPTRRMTLSKPFVFSWNTRWRKPPKGGHGWRFGHCVKGIRSSMGFWGSVVSAIANISSCSRRLAADN